MSKLRTIGSGAGFDVSQSAGDILWRFHHLPESSLWELIKHWTALGQASAQNEKDFILVLSVTLKGCYICDLLLWKVWIRNSGCENPPTSNLHKRWQTFEWCFYYIILLLSIWFSYRHFNSFHTYKLVQFSSLHLGQRKTNNTTSAVHTQNIAFSSHCNSECFPHPWIHRTTYTFSDLTWIFYTSPTFISAFDSTSFRVIMFAAILTKLFTFLYFLNQLCSQLHISWHFHYFHCFPVTWTY